MTIAVDLNVADRADLVEVRRIPGIITASVASIGAGAVHAGAIGIHAEHPQLARIFVAVAVLQLGAGLIGLVRPSRLMAAAIAAVNLGAVGGWLTTRLTGISWIDGLEVREAAQFTDTVCALMGAVAVGAGVAALLVGWHMARPGRLMFPALAAAALTIPAMVSGSTHSHADGAHSDSAAAAGHSHDEAAAPAGGGNGAAPVPAAAGDDHHDDGDGHHDETTTTAAGDDADAAAAAPETTEHGHDDASDDHASDDTAHADDSHAHDDTTTTEADPQYRPWPRPFDPEGPLDLADVKGVTPEQQARAEALVEETLRELPQFADVNSIGARGYSSIGDGVTGFEHWINRNLIDGDDKFLDPSAPESLVYRIDKATGAKELVSAMFIAKTGVPMDDPSLTDFAGPLMTWHAHNNLCWGTNDQGKPVIVGLTDANGNCARGVKGGGDNAMVHVWIAPHYCGPFSALEGVGAGGAAIPEEERTDMCAEIHGEGHGGHGAEDDHADAEHVETKPYDPTKPIDLGGIEGVTPEQQAAAENLVAVNIVRLPQWADYKVAEAAGFHSIGDGITGHEHFVNWEWIDDDVWLDPDHPESLVFEPQPDGTKKLVSAMYMLPRTVALEDVPDIGGKLMQWHIHDNLCFTKDPVAPKVAGLTNGAGECPPSLQKFQPSAMIHVWITPHPCGPFAALEGVGAGQILEGEERLCDHAHGSGGF